MRSTRSPSWGEEGSVQEFQFDGAYAGSASPRKEDARPTKRQPKRRGLWNACFAQPRVDEPASSPPSQASSPSSLTLTAQQLAFRHRGSPETQRLPLCSIKHVEVKWILAGGVRVSKVTITLDSGKDPVVIRGLKNPEDLVDAVKKRQKAAVEPGIKSQEAEGRPCDAPGTSPAGRWSEAAASPAKRVMITPRALFADTPGSPASAPTSGCGSMTLMSAFARSPAQEFAGADSVAREIQLASPGREDLSYSGSSADSLAHDIDEEVPVYVATRPAAAGASPPSRMPLSADTRMAALRGPPPPRQPSDSIAIPAPSSLQLAAGVVLTQYSPVSPGCSSRTDGGCPAPEGALLLGGSPPPRAEDSMPEGASVPSSVQGSPRSAPPCTAGGNPPPVPEDSVVVYGAAGVDSTPGSSLSSAAPGTIGRTLSPGSCPDEGMRLEEVSFPAPRISDAAAAAGVTLEDETPRLLLPSTSTRRRQQEGRSSHRLARSSLPSAAPHHATAGESSHDNLAGPVVQSAGCGSSFQSTSSGDLTDASQLASASAPSPGPSGSPALEPAPGLSSGPSDRRGTSPVGAVGIAAVSATVSAVLTSAASAGLGAVGLVASPPPLAGGAAGSAAASVAAAPLTLLGLTAAAAVTLVAAAAVTHIRTGSPLGPLESPCGVNLWEAAAQPEPLLSVGTRASAGQVPDSPASWFGSHRSNTVSCGKAAGEAAPGSERSVSGAAAAYAPVAVVTATGAALGAGGEDEPPAGGISRAGATPAPDLAAEPSLRCNPGCPGTETAGGGGLEEAGCLSSATGASGSTADSGDGSEEDAAASGAWGSQHTLVDLDTEHGPAAGAGPAARAQVRPSLGGGSATAAASCTGEQHQAEEEALPVMLFSEGPGGMPPLERIVGVQDEAQAMAAAAHSAQDMHSQQQPAASRTVDGDSAACGGQWGQPATGAVHGGELRPPPQPPLVRAAAQAEPAGPCACSVTAPEGDDPYQAGQGHWRSSRQPVASWHDPTVRRLFPGEEEERAVHAAHAPQLRAVVQSAVAAMDQSSPAAVLVSGLASPAAAAGAASPATRRPRTHRLTESPVRVLYSVHAAATGPPAADPRATRSPQWAQPTLETCESAVQTEPPVAECAVQTGAEARGSAGVAGRSRGGTAYGVGATCSWGAPASAVVQPLAKSAMQRLFTLNSPRESGSGGASGSISVAAGSDGPGEGPSPPQAGAQDWYLSSVGADAAPGGFGLAASASIGQDRRVVPTEEPGRTWGGISEEAKDYLRSLLSNRGPMPPVRPSTAESPSICSSSSQLPCSSGPAAAARSAEGAGASTSAASPQTGPRYTLSLCYNSSARSRPAGEEGERVAHSSARDGGGDRGAASAASVAATSGTTTLLSGLSTADSVRRMVEAALLAQQRQQQQLLEQQQQQQPQQQLQVPRLQEQQLVMQLHLPGGARAVERSASPSRSVHQSQSESQSESESRTASPSSVSGGSSSVPLSASVDTGLYTRLLSDAGVSGDREGSAAATAGASPPPLGHSPTSSCAPLLAASTASPRGSSSGADGADGGGDVAANAAAASASPAAAEGTSSSVTDAAVADSERGTDPQRPLLSPGVPLSAEPLTPWTHRGSCSLYTFAAAGGASSPSVCNAQDDISSGGRAGAGPCDASIVAAEPASSSRLRSAGSDTADEMMWLLAPSARVARVSDDAASAPASPRIPPPPPLAHSNNTSRGGSASNRSPSRRITLETESLGGTAGCCTSRRSSVGSCSDAAAAAEDRASLAWHMTRVSAVHAAHTGASPAPDPCSDGNQFATLLLFSGAGDLSAERGSSAEHVPGQLSRAGSSDSGHSRSRSSDGGSEVSDSNRAVDGPSDPLGDVDLLGDVVGAVGDLEADRAATGCSCSGDGGGSASLGAASSGSQTGSPAPQSPSAASIAASQAAAPSPDLSDISSAAYAAGAYVYGSPYSSPGSGVGGGPRAADADGSAAADGGAGDDLFQNPLYATPGNETAGTSPRGRPPRDSGGCIALPLTPYSESQAYTGGGASTCATTPEPAGASQQPSVASELHVGASRRRTREEATATSLFLFDDGGLQRAAAGQFGAGAVDPRRTADAAAASRLGSADGGGGRPHVAAPVAAATAAAADWAAFAAEGSAAAGSGPGSAEGQPQKRARMQVPDPEEAVGASPGAAQQQQQAQVHAWQPFSTPAPPQGAPGCAAPAPRGLPLVSPFMVLNPTYAGSTGGSPAVTSSPPAAAQSDDVSAAHADAEARPCLAVADWTPRWDVAVVKQEAAGCRVEDGDGAAVTGALELVDQQYALQTTPRNRELAQLQSSDLGSLQGSPSSHQAVHAATLLRHANDAVDFARDAVQRGDAEWLSQVAATLQAVQSALDALREF
ncbi:hypothetical protein PLESTB_001231100 [Pleodorina starrii]|uniref:Uncharacterized protein n=1 Tax=Pleodorina starrii TaxID=330485 RepID=A0A9W6BS61_9CHLO|nr:hypothetical protein PLESTM_000228700 [Pleodorina starrii]GLC57476.1 hypothetical protein PLESTB_001231100 [Pleodorina starrii]GLC63148.1 hypothetical protein PLESTF_000005100 [Pleodorina starrii]